MNSYGNGPRATGQVQLQPGTELDVGKDQAATLVEIWAGLWDDLLTQAPVKDAPHPSFPGLLFQSRKVTLGKMGMAQARLTYKGLDPRLAVNAAGIPVDGEGNPEFPEVDLEEDTDVEEVPIRAHPDFAALVTAAGGYVQGKAAKDPKTGLFLGFGPESGGDLAGVESYLVGRTVVTRYWYSENKANLEVGVIVDGGLRMSVRSARQGVIWKNTEVVRYGNPNPLIYS